MLTLLILSGIGIVTAVGLAAITDPCSLDNLTADSKCLNCFSKTEKQAALVYWLAQALKAGGGADYTNINDLEDAVKCLRCEPTFVLDSFDVAIAQTLALDEGASNLTVTELRAAIKCWVCADPKVLRAAETLLRCKLNSVVTGPPIL